MPDIEFVRGEIQRMRAQVNRQRSEIRQLKRANISTASAELLLQPCSTRSTHLCRAGQAQG
jgi:hypothetical protein